MLVKFTMQILYLSHSFRQQFSCYNLSDLQKKALIQNTEFDSSLKSLLTNVGLQVDTIINMIVKESRMKLATELVHLQEHLKSLLSVTKDETDQMIFSIESSTAGSTLFTGQNKTVKVVEDSLALFINHQKKEDNEQVSKINKTKQKNIEASPQLENKFHANVKKSSLQLNEIQNGNKLPDKDQQILVHSSKIQLAPISNSLNSYRESRLLTKETQIDTSALSNISKSQSIDLRLHVGASTTRGFISEQPSPQNITNKAKYEDYHSISRHIYQDKELTPLRNSHIRIENDNEGREKKLINIVDTKASNLGIKPSLSLGNHTTIQNIPKLNSFEHKEGQDILLQSSDTNMSNSLAIVTTASAEHIIEKLQTPNNGNYMTIYGILGLEGKPVISMQRPEFKKYQKDKLFSDLIALNSDVKKSRDIYKRFFEDVAIRKPRLVVTNVEKNGENTLKKTTDCKLNIQQSRASPSKIITSKIYRAGITIQATGSLTSKSSYRNQELRKSVAIPLIKDIPKVIDDNLLTFEVDNTRIKAQTERLREDRYAKSDQLAAKKLRLPRLDLNTPSDSLISSKTYQSQELILGKRSLFSPKQSPVPEKQAHPPSKSFFQNSNESESTVNGKLNINHPSSPRGLLSSRSSSKSS